MSATPSTTQACPCGSGLQYAECCQPLHTGKREPATAEALMRARYCAFAQGLPEYLVTTTHPEKRTAQLQAELNRIADQTQWLGLEVINVVKGTAQDKIGRVQFRAHFRFNGSNRVHEETSRFKRYKGDWIYYDGD